MVTTTQAAVILTPPPQNSEPQSHHSAVRAWRENPIVEARLRMRYPSSDQEELLDVVDDDDQVIAQATRGAIHRARLRHRAAHILVITQLANYFCSAEPCGRSVRRAYGILRPPVTLRQGRTMRLPLAENWRRSWGSPRPYRSRACSNWRRQWPRVANLSRSS